MDRGEFGIELREQLAVTYAGVAMTTPSTASASSSRAHAIAPVPRSRARRHGPRDLGAREAARRASRARPSRRAARETGCVSRARRSQAAEQAPVLALDRAELREGRAQRELLAVSAVDAGHERLDEPSYASRPNRRETNAATDSSSTPSEGGTSASAAKRTFPARRGARSSRARRGSSGSSR
jgi:hypothetical protein